MGKKFSIPYIEQILLANRGTMLLLTNDTKSQSEDPKIENNLDDPETYVKITLKYICKK